MFDYGERTLPVLEAAHIQPYSDEGPHEIKNGLLLRSDLHRLFDAHFLTIDPDDRRILVSSRIREVWENGREYYVLHGKNLRAPIDPAALPSDQYLRYHANKFQG